MPASMLMIRLGSGCCLETRLPAELIILTSALAAALTRPSPFSEPATASPSLAPQPSAASSLKLRVFLVSRRLAALLRRLEGWEPVLRALPGLLLLVPLPCRLYALAEKGAT
jgi:hypothetical protein